MYGEIYQVLKLSNGYMRTKKNVKIPSICSVSYILVYSLLFIKTIRSTFYISALYTLTVRFILISGSDPQGTVTRCTPI